MGHSAQSAAIEFSLIRNNPQVRTLRIIFSIPFLVWWAGMLTLLATGTVGWQEALITTSILSLGWGFVFWNIQKYGRGSAIIYPSELVVKTRGYTANIPWSDVSGVTLASFADRGVRVWARAIHWSERKPYVELRLSRALRDAWPRGRYGTRVTGIPLIGGDRIALYVNDPESFVRSAKTHLGTSGD